MGSRLAVSCWWSSSTLAASLKTGMTIERYGRAAISAEYTRSVPGAGSVAILREFSLSRPRRPWLNPAMTTVTDGSYRSRILGLIGERNPLESMEASAKRVEAPARKLGDAGLARSYGPGKWTGKQILAHLADAEL